MRLPKFEYLEPKSVKEASSILADNPTSKILAGGTDLLVNMKHKVETPSILVNLKRVSDLNFVIQDNGVLRIGALTPLKEIYKRQFIVEKAPVLASAASSVGSYHHQAMGTLGGNICQQNRCKFYNQSLWWRSARATCFKAGGKICHVVNKNDICYSSYSGDVVPALLVLDANVMLESKNENRQIPLRDLYSDDGKDPLNLERGEILTEIVIPEVGAKGFSTYLKFANRESIDFPIVGHALWASKEKTECKLAFTAVDRKPVRLKNLEGFLSGKNLSEELVEEAAIIAAKEAKPVSNSIYPPSYKRRIMGLLVRRAMNEAMRRIA